MSERMRILVAYDGSECGDAAIEDLVHAALPQAVDALVVTVAEVWVKAEPEETPTTAEAHVMSARARQGLQAAEASAKAAMEKLQGMFPGWQIETRVSADSPAWGVLRVADEWQPQMIVVGSHGRSALGRLLLGSVSQKVLTEAQCSVRIGRRHGTIAGAPLWLVIGVDDTPDSTTAVESIATRSWPAGTSVRVVAAIEPADLPIGVPMNYDVTQWVTEGTEQLRQRMTKAVEGAVERLRAAGLSADAAVDEGSPAPMLLDQAEELGAACIVLGARGHRFLERFLLGSVSSAVATRAHCSVEVHRRAK